MNESPAFVPARAEVTAVIIRACARCGCPRDLGAPCGGCGNPDAPVVTDLGTVSASYRNPLRRALRHVVGEPMARRRIRNANRATEGN